MEAYFANQEHLRIHLKYEAQKFNKIHMADALEMQPSNLYAILNGTRPAGIGTLVKIANLMDMTVTFHPGYISVTMRE